MLKEISSVIRGQLRDYDFLARYGGDEFVAIVPETQTADVLELCRRIEDAVNGFELPVDDNQVARVGVSLGAACYPANGETFDQIIIAADKAMYTTKAFHKKRNHRMEEQLQTPRSPESEEISSRLATILPAVPMPIEEIPVEFEAMDILDANDSLIVELDETHIVSSGAVN
jgi:predicted signal transduction protein with EAL and GGDEF domain